MTEDQLRLKQLAESIHELTKKIEQFNESILEVTRQMENLPRAIRDANMLRTYPTGNVAEPWKESQK